MSRAGPAAALALKTQSRLSAADNAFAATAAAGQALNAAAAAAAAADARSSGGSPSSPARLSRDQDPSASLPAQPAAVSSTGGRPSQSLAAYQGQFQPPRAAGSRATFFRDGARPLCWQLPAAATAFTPIVISPR
jgi:hypothetical protein